MELWRVAVTSCLWKAHRDGLLEQTSLADEFNDVILEQVQREWNIHITRRMSKMHFLKYAGRYIRRLPISQKNILEVSEQEVVYRAKDTRRKTYVEVRSTLAEFVAILAQHILDRYKHSMRYFGLLAPRTKRITSAGVFALLEHFHKWCRVYIGDALRHEFTWRVATVMICDGSILVPTIGAKVRWGNWLRVLA
jgi:hypothetical protein